MTMMKKRKKRKRESCYHHYYHPHYYYYHYYHHLHCPSLCQHGRGCLATGAPLPGRSISESLLRSLRAGAMPTPAAPPPALAQPQSLQMSFPEITPITTNHSKMHSTCIMYVVDDRGEIYPDLVRGRYPRGKCLLT